MNRIITVTIISIVILTVLHHAPAMESLTNPLPEAHETTTTALGLQQLVRAYPDFLESAEGNVLRWKDGTEMIYDDGIHNKSYEDLLNNPSLKDQMAQIYVAGAAYEIPTLNFDPGRVRSEPFFRKMYGDTAEKVQATLKPVKWLPKSTNSIILITGINGVNEKLQAISYELDMLSDDLKKYVSKLAGTFNWRPIAKTNRLSPHSFGIAIDINCDYSDYWLWDAQRDGGKQRYRNRIPLEIVEIFEKHGFIWGGKWYHYDTMHFEYRPELLI